MNVIKTTLTKELLDIAWEQVKMPILSSKDAKDELWEAILNLQASLLPANHSSARDDLAPSPK